MMVCVVEMGSAKEFDTDIMKEALGSSTTSSSATDSSATGSSTTGLWRPAP